MTSILKNKNLKILLEWDQESFLSSGCNPHDLLNLLVKNNFKIFYPEYEDNRYYEISPEELILKKSNNTINLLCRK